MLLKFSIAASMSELVLRGTLSLVEKVVESIPICLPVAESGWGDVKYYLG
jgi:hypothetical protein